MKIKETWWILAWGKEVCARILPNEEVSDMRLIALSSYLECAFWSSTYDEKEEKNFDDFSGADLSDDAIKQALKDVDSFIEKAGGLLLGFRMSQVMHDFWLTRNHHGAGFWDGDYPKKIGDKLTKLSHTFKECYLILGDDGKIYIE